MEGSDGEEKIVVYSPAFLINMVALLTMLLVPLQWRVRALLNVLQV